MSKQKQLGCDYEGYEFGAHYLDSVCIDGYLWDADKFEDGHFYGEGDLPCPQCNRSGWRAYHRDTRIEDAMVRCEERRWPFRKSYGGHVWGYAMQVRGIIEWVLDCARSALKSVQPK